MTAINAFLRPDRGFLMADGAFYSSGGQPLGFGSKIVSIPHLHMAIAARGLSSIAPVLAHHLCLAYRDFDDLVSKAEHDLAEWSDHHADELEATGFPEFELHMMGWSKEQARPRHFIFTFTPGEDASTEFVEETSFVACPGLDQEEYLKNLPKVGVFVYDDGFVSRFDPAHDGVKIMMAQRRQVDELKGHEENGKVCIVGGHIEVTEITEEGISQRVLHRWSDQVGVFVEPEAMSPRDVMRARIALRNQKVAEAARTAA